MPRSAKRIQKVTNVFEEARLSIVKGRKADQPDLWEAEMRLGSPAKRHYRKLNATDEHRAGAEAYKLFCKLDQRAAAGVPISGPTFAKLEPLYRAALDKKIAQLREDVKARPIIAEAKVAGTHEKNFQTFKSRLLPFFGKMPIRGISEQELARFVATLQGRGGGTPKVSTVKALNGVFRDAMKCGIAEGWITTEAIPKLPVSGQGRSAPRPAFSAGEWQKALAGMTDRWVATGLTAEDDQRNAALSPMDRYVPRLRRDSVENRRIARAYAVILGASQARPGTEFDYIRPCDFRLTEHRFRLRLDEAARCTSLVLTSIVDWTAFLGVGRTRWASATFLAANFRDSFPGLAMRRQGVALAEADTISARLRFRGAHPNGRRVTVLAATSRKMMSKRLASADLGAGETVGERVLAAIRALWPDADYCWSHNRNVPDDALAGVRMPVIAHGLNCFSALTKVAALAAMNLPNHLLAALAEAGFPAGAVRRAIMIESTYQSVLRSAARDPNSTAEVTMVVPDMDCAEFVASLFPGAKIGLLGVAEPPRKAPGRPKMHDGGDADRKAFVREMDGARAAISAEALRERALADIREGEPTYEVHAYADLHQKTPTTSGEAEDFHDLVRFLRGWFDEAPGSNKKDNWLLLQARLQAVDPEQGGGHATVRGEANVERRSTLWIDVESLGGGRSGPPILLTELRRVLGCDIRMAAYTSFGHRAVPGGWRYRVVIPLSVAVGVECYRLLYRLVLDALERARWMTWKDEKEVRKGRFHGIDMSKAPACSMFYAPLRPAEAETDAWFEDLSGKPLDVRAWLARDLVRCLPPENLLPPPPATWEAVEGTVISPMTPWDRDLLLRRADEMCSGYLALGHGVQDGELNRLAWRLARLGLPLAEIEPRLLNCAAGSRSRTDRTRQVPRIMAALARRGPG